MRTYFLPALLLTSISAAIPAHATSAVDALIRRVTPQAAAKFRTETRRGEKSGRFEIATENGQIVLRGSTPNEQAAAYGWYLKHVAKTQLSWNGDQLALPKRLPAPKTPLQISSPYAKRYAYNYCSLSYSSAFWDWNRWQRELDFLAVNGFNQCLISAGTERVWQQTLRELGYPDDKIQNFIASPAYAAWWHMGNLEGEGAKLSATQIANEAALGRKIADRCRELGIQPVLTGFVGLLPHDIGATLPALELLPQGDWGGYQRPIVLKPTSAEFGRIAAIWYRNLHQVYGNASAYTGDLFHEGGKPGDTDLTAAAQAVQSAMQKTSPGATWVIQGWQGNPVPQLIAGTDPQHTQILQLCRNMKEGDNGAPLRTYDGRSWVWGELANFGGKLGLYGGVPMLTQLPTMLLNPAQNRGQIVGLGLLSEGIERNPLYYDLFFDQFWRDKPVEIGAWLNDYARRRYGRDNAMARRALGLLLDSGIYAPTGVREGPTESILCAKPARDVRKASSWSNGEVYYDPAKIARAAQELWKAAPQLKAQETYRYDLVDWTRQTLGDLARPILADAMSAYDRKDAPAFQRHATRFLDLLRDSDRLLASDENFLLGTWIARARAKGTTPAEKAAMESDARTLITTWSGQIDALNDYSHRQWAGLMRDYYLPRWQTFFDDHAQVLAGHKSATELANWYQIRRANADLAFAHETKSYATKAQGDTIAIAGELLQKYVPIALEYAQQAKSSKDYAWKLTPNLREFSFDVNETIVQAGTYRATFQWQNGDSALKIHRVALYEGAQKVAEDAHEGWTGDENRQNSYTLILPRLRTNLDSYTLRAQVEGASSLNSSGVLKLVHVK